MIAMGAALLTGCPKNNGGVDLEALATDPTWNFTEGVKATTPDRKGNVDWAAAYEFFRKSADELNGGPKASFNAGWVAERLEQNDKASMHYKKAFDADPKYEAALYSYVRLARAAGDSAAVATAFDTALKADPSNEQLATDYMDALIADNRPGEALEQGREVLRKNPDNDAVYRSLSGLYLKQGKLSMASIMGDKALELNDADPNIYNNMGVVHLFQRY